MDRPAPMHPIRASSRPKARRRSTTGNSWPIRWCCGAPASRRRRVMRGSATATSSIRIKGGPSWDCDWPRTRPYRPRRRRATERSPGSARDLIAGLSQSPKVASPKWFYDAEGSRPVRGHHPPAGILSDAAGGGPAAHGRAATGPTRSGLTRCWSSSDRGPARRRGSFWTPRRRLAAYVPIDISADALNGAVAADQRGLSRSEGRAVWSATSCTWPPLPEGIGSGRRIGFFPGRPSAIWSGTRRSPS